MICRLLSLCLGLLLVTAPGLARAEWHEASSEHFVVYSDDGPEQIREFSERLERFDKAMRLLWKQPDVPPGNANRVTIYVIRNPGDMERLAGSSMVRGFYRARAGGSFAVVPHKSGAEFATELGAMMVLCHEYAHHFMYSSWPNAAYPSWFVEGFAEFHAAARFEKDGSVALGLVPQYRGYALFEGAPLPMEKLLVAESLKLTGEQVDTLYGRGWLLTHYLLFQPDRAGQLDAYLDAINRGQEPLAAAQAVFGDLGQLDRALNRHKSGSVPGRRVNAEWIKPGPVAVRPLTAGEAATMKVRITSKNGVNKDTAPDVYAAAKRAAAPYPDDPGAQIVLAEAAFDAGDFPEAEAAADRALAANPKAIDALVYKAMARQAAAKKAGDTSRAKMREVQKLLAQANALDPDDPEPLILFYRSFGEFGVAPTRNATDAFYTTFALAPYDKGLRMQLANAYLSDGDPARARVLLRPLAFDPHDNELAKEATELIAKIDAGEFPSRNSPPETATPAKPASS